MRPKVVDRILSVGLFAAGFFLALGFVTELLRVDWLRKKPAVFLLGAVAWSFAARLARKFASLINRSSLVLVGSAAEALVGSGSLLSALAIAGLPIYAVLVTAICAALEFVVPLGRLQLVALFFTGALVAQHLFAVGGWAKSGGGDGARVDRALAWGAVVVMNALSLGFLFSVLLPPFSGLRLLENAALFFRHML